VKSKVTDQRRLSYRVTDIQGATKGREGKRKRETELIPDVPLAASYRRTVQSAVIEGNVDTQRINRFDGSVGRSGERGVGRFRRAESGNRARALSSMNESNAKGPLRRDRFRKD